MIHNNKKNSQLNHLNQRYYRRVSGERLAYYKTTADAAFWDQHWQKNFSNKIYLKAEQGKLGQFENFFIKYLPKDSCIIESGCGLGQYVLALRVRGYAIEGVDWAEETVNFALRHYPNLPIRGGDVTKLDVEDEYYGGYISLGVVEHRQDGPEPYLQEAYRLLKPGGIALISVPYFNTLRRLKARIGIYRDQIDGLDFYQYAYTEDEFTGLLKRFGFHVINHTPLSPYKGITDELSILRILGKSRPTRLLLQALFTLRCFRQFGHSILFVATKQI